ncbi:MAG: M56 family metallopeptidase [Balneolaceae bacterium]|nr:M56 family metallopeptidase [Balneolaceae bacterium]
MGLDFSALSNFGEQAFHQFWIPFLWWTTLVGIVLYLVQMRKSNQPFFDYYLRVALLISFPTAIFLNWIITPITSLFAGSITESSSVFAVLTVPVPDLSFSAYSTGASYATSFNFYSFVALTTYFVMILSCYRIIQLMVNLENLRRLRQKLKLDLLSDHNQLNSANFRSASNYHSQIFIGSADVSTPFTFGWETPIIVVPKFLQDDHTTFNMIVAHELIHIHRRDYKLNVFISFIRSLIGFNPLINHLITQINDFRETSCDQEVITEFHASPTQYAKLIFSVSQSSDHQPNLQIALTEQSSNLKKRIQNMSMIKSKPQKALNLASITLIALTITVATACTETSSQSDFPEMETKSPPFLNLEQVQPQEYKIYIDGTLTEVENLNEAILTENIGSLRVDNSGTTKAIYITSKTAEKADNKNSDAEFFSKVEQMPEPSGGISSLIKQINYPEEARKTGIEGRVVVQFVVDKDGNVQNPQVIKGIGGGCDEEALRVIKNTKFTPGLQRGQKVNVQMSMPIVFRLQK